MMEALGLHTASELGWEETSSHPALKIWVITPWSFESASKSRAFFNIGLHRALKSFTFQH